jgi:phosphonopyruvate decarboxylase
VIHTADFGRELKELGFDFYTGVPCSYLKSLINYAINECDYVGAANEGDAVAIAAGASLGGKKPVVLMQNSGLSNAVSPLVSLNYPFQIPVLGFVSWRGQPGFPDEPQHELMGRITTQMLDIMQVKWMYLSLEWQEAIGQLTIAAKYIERNIPFFFVVRKNTFEPEALQQHEKTTCIVNQVHVSKDRDNQFPTRQEVLRVINGWKDDRTVQLATTGKTGRQLYEIEDDWHNFYMVGSMGCVGTFGLGIALNKPEFNIWVIDGDGALLMRMGSLATIGYYHPHNLLHILLDNNAHDSTGGQKTVSHNMDFVAIARACGYAQAIYVHDLDQLNECLQAWKQTKSITFLHLKISNGEETLLGRPNLKPYEVKERLKLFLNRGEV